MGKERIEELVTRLNEYRKSYFEEGVSLIPDEEYDLLYRELLDAEKQHPQWVMVNSPTLVVGYPVTAPKDKQLKHHQPLLSLGNVFNFEELKEWLKGVGDVSALVVENKLDGLAVSLTYRDGLLSHAVTRGDGTVGENITRNVQGMVGIPTRLNGHLLSKGTFEVHGEVVMLRDVFVVKNEIAIQQGKRPYANLRNAAAGALRANTVDNTGLVFCPYGGDERLISVSGLKSYADLIQLLHDSGFDTSYTNTMLVGVGETDDIEKLYHGKISTRDQLNYDIDGTVIKLDSLVERKRLGDRGREPKWAIAYKFPAGKAVSKVTGVSWSVGRTGLITPVANIEPITLMGVVITNVNLHNIDEIVRLGLTVGSTVLVSRQGDVIPKIVEVLEGSDTQPVVTLPTHCPCCASHLEQKGPQFYCRNRNCTDVLVARLEYFASRVCMDINGIGPEVARHLITNNLVFNEFDVFALPTKQNELLSTGFGQQTIHNLFSEILKNNEIRLDRFITGLMIPGFGIGTATIVAVHYGDIESFVEAIVTPDHIKELSELENIGPILLENWESYFSLNKDMVVQVSQSPHFKILPMPVKDHRLKDKVYVISGTFNIPREVIKEKLIMLGAKVSGTVSPKTTALILGDGGGSKQKKALSLSIPIMNEIELLELLQ